MRLAIVVATEPEVKPLGLSGNFEFNLKEASKLGYNGVELLIKDPDRFDLDKIKRLTEGFNLAIPAIGSGPTYTIYGLSLSSQIKAIREKALKRIEEYLKIGKMLNAGIILGSVKGKTKDKYGIKNLKNSLIKCAELAENIGARIWVEPLNRYESNLINTLGEAIELKDEIGSSKIGLVADTFHMNIEEISIYESIIKANSYIEHVHFADSNRLAPGQGHLDFKEIIHALKEINYSSFITAEILPFPNQYDAARLTIEYLKSLL